MNLRPTIEQVKVWAHGPAPSMSSRNFPINLCYWLAGARRSTLEQLPESERERIAILGSSVLIPTLLAFFGMYLYTASRFQSSRPVVTVLIALTWAFIIMQVDRILMATYRPFQSRIRKTIQVCFRLGLSAVISVAIAFPFCLEQYQGAIRERLQGEYRQRLDTLQTQERTERDLISQREGAKVSALRKQRDALLASGPVEPALYAEELAKQQGQRQGETTRNFKQQLEQEASKALAEWKEISARMRVVEQDLKDEARGKLAAERGGTGKSGQGAKYRELARDLALLASAEQAARVRYEQLLARAAQVQPAAPGKDLLSTLQPAQQQHVLAEATQRAKRIEQLNLALASAEREQNQQLASHALRFDPVLQTYLAKSQGQFDPMEQTIGLFKVIFVPEKGGEVIDPLVQKYKWMAALFQFSIIFGTLFLLDLIAILSKVMSRPGPYDVMVEFPELVVTRNLEALRGHYPDQAQNWAALVATDTRPNGTQVDLRHAEQVAKLLLTAHLPGAQQKET